MAWASWGTVYQKSEKSPLDRFKNRNRLLQAFGENGPRAYDLLDGASNAEAVMETSGIDREDFAAIMDFMVSNGIAKTASAKGGKAAAAPKPPASSRKAPKISPKPTEEEAETSEENEEEGAEEAGEEEGGKEQSAKEDADEEELSSSLDEGEEAPEEEEEKEPIKISQKGKGQKKSPKEEYSDSLSPLERLIFDKHGESGVKVYNLIDGEKTAEEILKETGITEEKLVEILEFMNEEGIIKLEKPPEAKKPPPRAPAFKAPVEEKEETEEGEEEELPSPEPKPTGEVGFKPMVEGAPSEAKAPAQQMAQPSKYIQTPGAEKDELGPGVVPVDVPMAPKYSIIQQLKLRLTLMRLGSNAASIFSKVDGERDFIDIAVETRQPLPNIDISLGELGKAGLMSFRQLTRGELQRRYGDDGFAVYKRYGRDGLLIYQLIGKVRSLRDIVSLTRIEPQKAGEIILFVHKVLGLDMPLERDMIYRYLQR